MKRISLIVLAVLVTAILLTGCPGPNDNEVPKGTINISLSDEVIKVLADDNQVKVQFFPQNDPSNIVREVTLTKANPSGSVDVTPGTYGIVMSNSSDVFLGLNFKTVSVVDKEVKSISVIKEAVGNFKISLSEDVVAAMTDYNYITVKIAAEETPSTILREVKLTKANSSSSIDLVTGKYRLGLEYSASIRIGLSSSSVTITENEVASLEVTKEDSGKLFFVFDDESIKTLESLSNSDRIELILSQNNISRHSIKFSRRFSTDGYNIAPGTYNVNIKSDVTDIGASVSTEIVTIEKDQSTEIGISVYATGSLYVNFQNLKDQSISAAVSILKDGKEIKTVTDSEYITLPVGSYELAAKTDDSDVDVSLSSTSVVIGKGDYKTVMVSAAQQGTVKVKPSSDLLDSIGSGEVKVSFKQGGTTVFDYMLSAFSDRSISLPVGTYEVEIESPESSKVKYTVMTPVIDVSFGQVISLDLVIEKTEEMKINYSSDIELLKDSTVTLYFSKGNDTKEFVINKDNASGTFELKTGKYNVYYSCDNPKISVEFDKKTILIDGEDDSLNISFIQNGTVKIDLNVVGDLGNNSFSLILSNESLKKQVDFDSNSGECITFYLPVGEYEASITNDPTQVSVESKGIPDTGKVTISYEEDLNITLKVNTGGTLSGSITNNMTGDLDFSIYIRNEGDVRIIGVAGNDISSATTVIWYDTNTGKISVDKELDITRLPDNLDNLEVRIYIDGKLRAAKKIDMKALGLVETE